MKKLCIAIIAVLFLTTVNAQEKKEAYTFTVVKENPYTSVKNQNRSSTCWSFSTIGLMESELLRMGKGEYDLSDMYIVYWTYLEKLEKYVRFHGTMNFGPGGGTRDIPYIIKKYGIVPESVYHGLNYGEKNHVHNELDQVMEAFAKVMASSKKPTTAWKNAALGILNAYLGEIPKEFEYQGKKYTPQSYAQSLGINYDDYVEIGSYTHHPYYTQFMLEIQDNWMFDKIYNVQLDEMLKIMDDAIMAGYSIAWASDISEKGFSWKNGVALIPDTENTDVTGSDMEKWTKMSERDAKMFAFEKPIKEKEITPEIRQEGFDNFETTDDHGMVIYGIAKDQNGNKFYMVKNSWGTEAKYNGIFYASEAFIKAKTISIMLNRNGVPKDLRKKLNF